MFSSLRVRLPLLFLAGIVLYGVVTTLIAIRLFENFAHDQTVSELRREAAGIAKLYSNAVKATFNNNPRRAPTFAAANLERATGDRIYYVGVPPFPGEKSGLKSLDLASIDWTSGETLTFEFTPPGLDRTYVAVAEPVSIRNQPIGAIVVAKEKADIADSVREFVRRLAIAGLFGLLVAGALAWYLSRGIVKPVLALSRAADEVAGGTTPSRSRRAPPARSATSPSGSSR